MNETPNPSIDTVTVIMIGGSYRFTTEAFNNVISKYMGTADAFTITQDLRNEVSDQVYGGPSSYYDNHNMAELLIILADIEHARMAYGQ